MHILLVNDDGPPSNQSSPYVHSLISTLQSAGHQVSVILPHVQRSWIGKAHIVGQTLTPTYFRPGTLLKDDGITSSRPFNDGGEEWVLIDGTPASCVQIGLHYLFKDRGPVDLVLSGPNYGRNTTAVFALSSGTLGGALEGATNGMKSIALSYAFDSRDHDADIISAASKISTKLVEKFASEWPEDVHVYSINVPLRKGVETTKILYTDMIQNRWTSGSSFKELIEEVDDVDPNEEEQKIREGNHTNVDASKPMGKRNQSTYKWAPNFEDIKKAVAEAGQGDGWAVSQGYISVTPLRANFWHLPQYKGEIKLNSDISRPVPLARRAKSVVYAHVDYPDPYVQPLIIQALDRAKPFTYQLVSSVEQLSNATDMKLQFTSYESIDFDHALPNPQSSLVCAYVIRKALIRKHYLSNTVSSWLVKHPKSLLASHFKACVHFELDFAEFLDEALVDAWDLNESMARNEESANDNGKEWWILKPGMSDGGNGIRLFSNLNELQSIFEDWEVDEENEEDEEEEEEINGDRDSALHETNQKTSTEDATDSGMTSQLRHFIAQPYINPPLLLPRYGNRKFHIRTYVLAVGALRVYVYREMLALFAAKEYKDPSPSESELDKMDLAAHLTNTCFQDDTTRNSSVHRFWALTDESLSADWGNMIFDQVCRVTGEVFEAAAREQMVHFQAIPNAFEIFGVDFLVDASANVWLLELNAYPDFKQTGPELQRVVVGGLFEEVVKVAIVPFFDSSRRHFYAGTDKMVLVKDIDLGRG